MSMLQLLKLRTHYHCGEKRPYYRGILHFIITILMFLSFAILNFKNNYVFLGTVFVFCSYMISTVFHMFHFEKKTDYKINLLDHFGVQLHGIGMQMLSSKFNISSYPTIIQTISFIVDDMLCLYLHNYISNIMHIITLFGSFAIGFFGTFGIEALTNIYYLFGMMFYIAGGLIYSFKFPKSNKLWGFHEIYHLFIGIADFIFFCDAYMNDYIRIY